VVLLLLLFIIIIIVVVVAAAAVLLWDILRQREALSFRSFTNDEFIFSVL